ncbi:MAG: cyclase family protein [Lachnospiraceae bacterium]|nr:cyclase family protein [Lachnospiraceae bacterium]
MIYDISQEVFSCQVYPGDPAPSREVISDMKQGALYNLSAFSMCAHNGTHVDAPYHFLEDGKTIEQIAIDAFVGDCYVVHHKGDVTGADAETILRQAKELGAPKRILIAGPATVTEEAATVFARARIRLIGNESQTVGPENAPMAVHKILLGAEVVLLEGIVLTDVPEGKYLLSAAPLNLAGCDGAPCRAVLIK